MPPMSTKESSLARDDTAIKVESIGENSIAVPKAFASTNTDIDAVPSIRLTSAAKETSPVSATTTTAIPNMKKFGYRRV